jgi:hypothetical protein
LNTTEFRNATNLYIAAMSLLIIALIPFAFSVRSIYLLLWRFKTDQKFFAWKHFMMLIVAGIILLGVIFVEAMGSLAHYVPSDTEIMIDNFVMWISSVGLILSVIGSFIAIVKGIMQMRRVKAG